MQMPMAPPLMHTRSGNAIERPQTPTSNGFTSPQATPQGSPSKNLLPPGAKELPNIFDNAMRLDPPSPTKVGRGLLSPGSPNKGTKTIEDTFTAHGIAPGSPTRLVGQENTPPGDRVGKLAQAAISRQEPYQPRSPAPRTKVEFPTFTEEEKTKLESAKVKRLANVTQIC
jgi:cell cycle protein kinase DBF2